MIPGPWLVARENAVTIIFGEMIDHLLHEVDIAQGKIMRLLQLAFLGTGFLLIAGCGGGPDLAEVKGKVLLDGKPLQEGQVDFIPDSSQGSEGAMATGTINKDGTFTLYTGTEEGVLIGHHKVAVKCPFRVDQGSSGSGPGDTGADGKKQGCPIPRKYWEVSTSNLTKEVKSDGQQITINLTSQ